MPRPKDYAVRVDRRSSTTFVIAFEGEKTEAAYFGAVLKDQRRINFVPLPSSGGRSAPSHLLQALQDWTLQNRVLKGDARLWLVLDVDHHFSGRHGAATRKVLEMAKKNGMNVAISAPSFEVWLLLHLENRDEPCEQEWLDQRLQQLLTGYRHATFRMETLRPNVAHAVARAKRLDLHPEADVPANPGSRIYLLMEELCQACPQRPPFDLGMTPSDG